MIRKVVYRKEFGKYLKSLLSKEKVFYRQHVEVIHRTCKALSDDAEHKFGVEKSSRSLRHYKLIIESTLLDKVFPPMGYRIHFAVDEKIVYVDSITFTDVVN